MYKNLYLFIIIFLFSNCSFLGKNNLNDVHNKCDIFNVNIQNIDYKNSLFYSKLKNALNDKFILLNNNSSSNNVCNVNIINITTTNYTPLTNTSGIASRNNKKINVKYSMQIKDKIINNNNIIVFYGSNISENYYSEYVGNRKIEDNDIELVSEKIFYSVIKDINKINN